MNQIMNQLMQIIFQYRFKNKNMEGNFYDKIV